MDNRVKASIDAATHIDPEPISCFKHGGGRFEIVDDEQTGRAAGVYFIGKNADDDDKPPIFVCSPLRVSALTCDDEGNSWGYQLQWRDRDGKCHTWACPASLFSGDSLDFRAELLNGGLRIATGRSRNLLAEFVQGFPVERMARCVSRLGWNGKKYVLPNDTIGGDNNEIVVFQNKHALKPAFSMSGSVVQWRENVAALAAGNSRVEFAISLGFAGAMLELAGESGGGFHCVGGSSTGKTTCLIAAASNWGKPGEFMRSWRATSNGLEGVAALHNDLTLILDELSELDPKSAASAAYMLSNGQGKIRANKSGTVTDIATWKLLFFSSGEESFNDLTRNAGQKLNAGAELRVAEISADVGLGLGCFEHLHNCATAEELSNLLRENAGQYYGAVGREFLKQLVKNRAECAERIRQGIKNFISNPQIVSDGSVGQVMRVARRFALVAIGGELATEFGLTGWEPGAAVNAAVKCFRSWLENFGTGHRETTRLLEQVRYFFELHGASRFQDASLADEKIINRAGFYKLDGLMDDRTKIY